jgi:hypothetical protein
MSKLPPIYGILDKGEKHLAKPEVKADIQKNVEEFKKRNAALPPNQSSKGGLRTQLSSKFNRCVKSVKKTVKARKGSNKESAAIAICTKSVLQKRGRTMKRYTRKRLVTQKKFRGGATVDPWKKYAERANTLDLGELDRLAQDITMDSSISAFPGSDSIDDVFIAAIKSGSRPLIQALYEKEMSKTFMLRQIDILLRSGHLAEENKEILTSIRGYVANLS